MNLLAVLQITSKQMDAGHEESNYVRQECSSSIVKQETDILHGVLS